MGRIPYIAEARLDFHAALLASVLKINADGVPTNADKSQKSSVSIANGILERIGRHQPGDRLAGQTSGTQFEIACKDFLSSTFMKLGHLRPGGWQIEQLTTRGGERIAQFYQYAHLVALAAAARGNPELKAALGGDYFITPDIVIARAPEDDATINKRAPLVDASISKLTYLRAANGGEPVLHASISCKWTIRSDRAQNSRSEALNLIRNRKGPLPHVVVVTGEPTPARIASLALGTGDIDCVYHFALDELVESVEACGHSDAKELLEVMIGGRRLKDISDLPLDLAI